MKTAHTQPLERPAWRLRITQSHLLMALAAALPGGLLLALQQARFWPFFIDDSYISLVYVRNFLAGNNLTYNGLFVEGFSNFLWVVGVSLLGAIGLDPVLAAKLLGVACAHACILAVVHVGYLLGGRWRDGLLAGLLLAATGPFVAWSVGGLEACLMGLLLVLTARYLLLEERTPDARWSWSAVTALLLALTRPEAIALVGLIWAWLVVQAALGRRSWRGLAVWTATVAVGFGLFLGWRYLMYQDLIPAPVYAKRSTLRDQIYAGTTRLAPLLREWSIALALLAVGTGGYLVGAWARRWHIALAAALVTSYTAFVVVAGGDWMPMFRYLVPIMPLAALLIAGGSAALVERLGSALPMAARALLTAALVAAPLVQLGLWTEARREEALATSAGTWARQKELGAYLASIDDGRTSIALIDAGAIAYYAGIPALDLFGLNNRQIARQPGTFGNRLDLAYVLGAEPTFVELHYLLSARGNPIFVNYGAASRLYYTREFQRWYEPRPDLPLSPFQRRAEPLAATMFDNFYAAQVTPPAAPTALAVGERATVPVEVANEGTGIWVASSKLYGGVVYVVARVLGADGAVLDEQWTPLREDLLPGERQVVEAQVMPIGQPGDYVLEVDLILNEIGRFSENGAAVARHPLTVR